MTTTAADHRAGFAPPESRLISRVSWGAIFAGGVTALAFMILFDFLGLGVGLLAVEPGGSGSALTSFGIGAVVFLVIAQILSMIAGGVVAGRMSGAPTLATAALHGAVVWALSTVAMVVLAAISSYVLTAGAASAISSATGALGSAARAAAPENLDLPEVQIPEIGIQSLPPEVRDALQQRNLTPDDLRREARAVVEQVVSARERRQIRDELASAARDILQSPSDAPADVRAAIDDVLGGEGAVLSQEDVAQARAALAQRLGISERQSEQIVSEIQRQFQQTIDEAQRLIEQARRQAVEAIDAAIRAVGRASLVAFFISIFGFGGAVGGAVAARPDEPVRNG